MTNKLQQYFPMIRTREEVLNEIESKNKLKNLFYEWTEENQNEFLDFCTGVKGIKIMYDFMIKEILNPENTLERVNELLTLLLGQRVRIVDVLPNDGTRLADESTLLITDMVVQLEDGSIANLEIQKIGYYFPGERSACYSADLLLRQYKRARGIKGKRFSYRDIKQVYTIVLFEKSPAEFQKFSNNYIHRFMQKSDTGVNINLLQEYLFIPLDIFKKNQQNENRSVKIENRLEAWLAFFCMDDPETIIEIIEKYPDFKEMYEQAYDVCRNIEEVMQMFSKELLELDRNTVKLMIDDMQKQIEEKDEEIGCQREQLSQKDEQLNQKDEQLNQKDEQLNQKDEQLNQKDEQLNQKDEQIKQKDEQIKQKDEQIRELDEQLRQLDEQIKQSEQEIQKMEETEKNNTDKL